MDTIKSKPYKLSPIVAELVDLNSKKFGIPAAEYISMCVKFCHKTNFVPDESSLKSTKLTSNFKTLNQLIKLEKDNKMNLTEVRNTIISFIKTQEKDILNPIKSTVDDLPKLMELYYIKTLGLIIDVLVSDEKERNKLKEYYK
ncbi:hypothetical protein [Pedobacter nutrimenti]|uniref:Uncharacterized protein n=1 Tax=Pedobacter nutrimenti TaxID=1241337 RepID=A0A318U7F1_9SPHI|nr:hypothetical protein [Pedobacter nutrimenti]PYF68462.1 hypothetical protein B0O44_11249 [Pedobacter nutrimenti]